MSFEGKDPEQARRGELERALRLLSHGRAPSAVLDALSRRLTNKLLHEPTQALKSATTEVEPIAPQ